MTRRPFALPATTHNHLPSHPRRKLLAGTISLPCAWAAVPRVDVQQAQAENMLETFVHSIASGDIDALARLLADDAVMLSDGGDLVSAIPQGVNGGALIAKVLQTTALQCGTDERIQALYLMRNPEKLTHIGGLQ